MRSWGAMGGRRAFAKRGGRGALPLTLAIATTLALACSRPPQRPLNVVLISIDSLRADHLGAYGYPRSTSPTLDAFAAESVLFETAISHAPWTLPAHASLLTSQYPRTHRVDGLEARLAPGAPTIATVLARHGYETAAVVSGPFMKTTFGLHGGFAHYDDSLATTREQSHRAVTSPTLHERALALLDRLTPPFFLFLHYWDVHYDYMPPQPFDRLFDPDYSGEIDARDFERSEAVHAGMNPRDLEHVVALYDGEIRYLDAYLGRIFDALRIRALFDDALIVFTADHGDEFYEHGEKGHGHSTYNELIRVPLIIHVPGAEPGRRIRQRVQLVDVFPTILDAVGASAEGLPLSGVSLMPLLRGQPLPERPAFAETTRFRRRKTRPAQFGYAQAVFAGRHKLIRHGSTELRDELYDLEADPGERNPLVDAARAAELRGLLEGWERSAPQGSRTHNQGIDRGTREQLQALGYLDGP